MTAGVAAARARTAEPSFRCSPRRSAGARAGRRGRAGPRRPMSPSAPDFLVLSGSSRVRTAASLNHAIYAARHGLRYVYDATPVPVRLIYLHKIHAIRRHLPQTDWLFWLDDDAFFTDLGRGLRTFLPADPAVEMAFCASPVNPDGGWTWMSAGQLFVRNTPAMLALLDTVIATDIHAVRAWWDPEKLGQFTRGDQDAIVYQLQRDDSHGRARERRAWQAFNSRPYHYESRLDEHFLCHFAVPGGKTKQELIAEFAARFGTTMALVDETELAPYRCSSGRRISPASSIRPPQRRDLPDGRHRRHLGRRGLHVRETPLVPSPGRSAHVRWSGLARRRSASAPPDLRIRTARGPPRRTPLQVRPRIPARGCPRTCGRSPRQSGYW